MDFLVALGILGAGFFAASWRISSRFLHYFQQEEYDNVRFLAWWLRSASIEKRATLTSLVFALALALSEESAGITTLPFPRVLLLSVVLALSIAYTGMSNDRQTVKKALVMTSRAKRILIGALIIQASIFIVVACAFRYTPWSPYYLLSLTLLIPFLLFIIPITLTGANLCLSPLESSVQKKYLQEAQAILSRVKPEIIGITGSYGKTSFKHILSHILASHAPTLATPGSINTLMGITRIIRERLRNEHAYFLVEMGAYGIGSIQRLCGLTPPKTAIVTAIGIAHMERFKTIEAVLHAKSELPKSLPKEGMAILNGDDLNLRRMASQLDCQVRFYGCDPNKGSLDCRLLQSENTEDGVQCSVDYQGKTYTFSIPIYGRHQALNATGAFLTAMSMGVAPITAIAALQTMPPITHRLVVQRSENGITTIDDAYNSNPAGFECALELLKSLRGNRKILITPGMVELGEKAEEAYRQIAPIAATACDLILLVAAHRMHSFRQSLLDQGFSSEKIREFATLREAQQWLNLDIRSGDVILYENDLPDLYETPTAFSLF